MPVAVSSSCEAGACQLHHALASARSANASGLITAVHLANGTYVVNGSAPEATFDSGTTAGTRIFTTRPS